MEARLTLRELLRQFPDDRVLIDQEGGQTTVAIYRQQCRAAELRRKVRWEINHLGVAFYRLQEPAGWPLGQIRGTLPNPFAVAKTTLPEPALLPEPEPAWEERRDVA